MESRLRDPQAVRIVEWLETGGNDGVGNGLLAVVEFGTPCLGPEKETCIADRNRETRQLKPSPLFPRPSTLNPLGSLAAYAMELLELLQFLELLQL
jgi:hypothetical protein